MSPGPDGAVRLDTRVTGVGAMAGEFLDEGIIVLFGDDAPDELQEVAVVHHADVNAGGVAAGDRVTITSGEGTATLEVLAVGEVANDNLVNLGHIVLKRNGETEPALPGDVCCDTGEIPTLSRGDHIVIAPGDQEPSTDHEQST